MNRGMAKKWKVGLALWLGLVGWVFSAAHATQTTPRKIVSINVCTDQLAMMLVSKDQWLSVSRLALDPELSVLAAEAENYPINNTDAEEIFLMKPDLVLAGTYNSRATVAMLRKLGLRVEEFEPTLSFDDIAEQMLRIGALIGREEEARRQIAQMKADLAAIKRPEQRKTLALYYANSYTAGRGTLIDDAVRLAGFDNLTDRIGVEGAARLPMELLVMEKPDVLVLSKRQWTPALAEENLAHPAIHRMVSDARLIELDDKLTVCGGPFSVEAVARLSEAGRD